MKFVIFLYHPQFCFRVKGSISILETRTMLDVLNLKYCYSYYGKELRWGYKFPYYPDMLSSPIDRLVQIRMDMYVAGWYDLLVILKQICIKYKITYADVLSIQHYSRKTEATISFMFADGFSRCNRANDVYFIEKILELTI